MTGAAVAVVPLAHVVTTALYAGFQLTVRLVVYPQMRDVPPPGFAQFEAGHQRRVSLLVGPLFAAVIASTVLLFVIAGVPRIAAAGAAALIGAILVVTAVGAAPAHGRLSSGFDAGVYARLLRWDSVRVLLALANVAVALAVVAQT